ncbi:MAG: hypothetical protein ABFS09_08990 [Thermodesulfobacteriota bacterium]
MPVTEISEGFCHLCGRLLIRLLVDFFFEMVCYAVGFVSLRIITIGKYPPGNKEMFSDGIVSMIGALVILGFCLWLVF